MALQWDKLSPQEFQQLQDLAAFECDAFDTKWSSFLKKLANYLSGPTVQLNIKKFTVANLEQWGTCNKTCQLVQSIVPSLDKSLQLINNYAPNEKINKSTAKKIIDALLPPLKRVQAYQESNLIQFLENSRNNFTNNTLAAVKDKMMSIKKSVERTGCQTLYWAKPDHCVMGNGQGIPHITGKNFKKFIHLLKQGDNKTFHNFICWANTKVSDEQIQQINDILTLKLKDNLDVSCKGNSTKIISGEIVRIRDAISQIDKCQSKNSEEEIVGIMASDTIYIDDDINFKGKRILLAIMAPTVVVVGKRKIVLDGNDESSEEIRPRGLENFKISEEKFDEKMWQNFKIRCPDATFDSLLKSARKSRITVKSDMAAIHYYLKDQPARCFYDEKIVTNTPHGAPGPPGETGGSFFGLANVFENSSKLTITSQGGKGGFGQHGAHGFRGMIGSDADTCSQNPWVKSTCKWQNVIWKGDGKIVNEKYYRDKTFLNLVKHKVFSQAGKINVTFLGTHQGTKGFNGGNGGAGGSGGNPGQIQIITLNQTDSFTKYALKGETGSPGLAGKGGSGGYTPEHNVKINIKIPSYSNHEQTLEISVLRNKETFEDGKNGIDGNNTQSMQSPFPAVDISTNLDSLFAEYRKMLRTSLEKQFSSEKIFDHLMSILENKQLTSNCSALSIVKDLLGYENTFPKLHDKINYTKLYFTLLNQTERKVELIKDHDEKRALHYTYTAILTKLYAIKNHKEEKYIANLNNFLNMFMEKLGEYKEVKKELAIIEENARFKADIDKQIEDANNVVSNSIQPKLEQLFTKIDSEVEELKKEVDQKEQELLEQRKKLEEQKEKMKKNFLARLFGNILKLIGSVVSLLGPIGMAAGTAISGAGALVTKFAVDQSAYEEPDVSDIGAKLDVFTNRFDSEAQQKEVLLKDMNTIIDHFTNAKKEFMDVYYTAKNAYEDVKSTVNNVMDTYEEIKDTYHTVVDEFTTIRENLRKYGNLDDTIFQKCRSTYEKVEKKFNGAIKNVETHFKGAKNAFKNLNKGFTNAKNAINKVTGGIDKIKNAVTTMKNSLSTVTNAFSSAKKIFSGVTSVATKAIGVVQQGGAMVADIMEDKSQMDKIDRALAENKKNLESVRRFRKSIDDKLKPMLEGMKKTVNNFPAMCKGKSEAQLMTVGWQVDQALDNVICVVGQMTKHFQVGENFKTTLTSIKEAVSLMTNIFRKIQDYGDKKKLADHCTKVQLAGSDIEIGNLEIRADVTNLTVAIQANLLLYDYRVWIKQIKLFVFPLPQTYLQTFKVPMALQSDDNSLNGYMTNAIKEVKRFRTQYIESNVYISKFDRLKHRAFFYKDTQTGPFFIWKNKDHEKAISRLLAGESVVFEALTMRSGMNALKFRRIDLVIRTNKKNQTLLNDILKNYMVKMKHIGNNYYNCDNVTYVATVVGQVFKFSYQYINREPVNINVVYDKILHGDYMLSPYTTWYIKLMNVSTAGYKLLVPFQRDVDVELSGEGEYFEDKPEVCEDDLSEYFQTKDQFVKSKKKEKVYDECPSRAIAAKGLLCCEFNDTFDPKEKYWCRAIVRKPETLDKVHNTSEDKHYYYYDRYFRKSVLSADDLNTKFRATCSLHHGHPRCIETFKNRQAYRPWFFYDDRAGGPFSRSYLFCHRGQCFARIQKQKGPLKGLVATHVNDNYYFYAKLFSESVIQAEDQFKYERCSPSVPDCAPAFENSTLLNFVWGPIPNEFEKENKS